MKQTKHKKQVQGTFITGCNDLEPYKQKTHRYAASFQLCRTFTKINK